MNHVISLTSLQQSLLTHTHNLDSLSLLSTTQQVTDSPRLLRVVFALFHLQHKVLI